MSFLKNKSLLKQKRLEKRRFKVGAKIKSKNPEYRLIIDRSLLYVSAQVIGKDGAVLASISDKKMEGQTKTDRARLSGEKFGQILKEKKITKISFDRGGYRYHGRIKAFAEGLRSAGIIF